MAEYIMKDLVRKAGLSGSVHISSAAVSDEEWDNPMYPKAQHKLREHAIPFRQHRSHKISKAEFAEADLIVVMDDSNLRWLSGIVGPLGDKVHKLMEYTGENRDVADPWYTRDFETAYQDIAKGCQSLLLHIQAQ